MLSSRPWSLREVKADWLRVRSEFYYLRTLLLGKRWIEALQRRADELDRQEPLSIDDSGDYWPITGKGVPDNSMVPSGALLLGHAQIEISKSDGRIWKFAVTGHMAP